MIGPETNGGFEVRCDDRRSVDLESAVPGSIAGKSVEPSFGVLTRRCYFRGFALVYLVAFLSLWSQVHGLIGQLGLLPAGKFLQAAYQRFGMDAYRMFPSLCWFGSGDLMLDVWCGLGVLLTLALLIGWCPRPALLLLWAIYLSLSVAGQDFLGFQWDTLLLEMTVCSWLFAPRGWRPDWRSAPPPLALWPLWGLAFKLMFLSGATKLLSGDPSWSDGSALKFHYYTQPIPNWPAWYAYQWPIGVHRAALVLMFIVEIGLPFLVFAGRWGHIVFGLGTIALMIAIEGTGNFGFFNLQTIVLCIPLLNDDFLRRFIPRRWRDPESVPQSSPATLGWRSVISRVAVAVLLSISLLKSVAEISATANPVKLPPAVITPIQWADTLLLSWGRPGILKPIAPFRTINGYGLFRVMTVRRNEIVVETSNDGEAWTECEFPYKPGDILRPPPIIAPHMPRLDWQMWFAALNPQGNQHWLAALIQRILNGSPTAVGFFRRPEWQSSPPKFVRLAFYEYEFTTAEQRHESGAWWRRRFLGYLTDTIGK